MPFFCLRRSGPAEAAYKPLDKSTSEKPVNRIYRFQDPGNDSVVKNNDSVQQDMNLPSSGQRELSSLTLSPQQKPAPSATCPLCQNKISTTDTSKPKPVSQEQSTFRKLEVNLPRFGPSYGDDTAAIKAAKDEAWKHVLAQTPDEEQSSLSGAYLSAMKRIEKEAKDTYDPAIVSRLKNSEFRERMMIDGCFFLQLALSILLGGPQQLGYPEKHVYFGLHKDGDATVNRWIKAMFFLGNQIPCVVIRELMKQRFFEDVIQKGTWNPPSDLPKLVLYLVVVLPELERMGRNSSLSSWLFSLGQNRIILPRFREPPSDLLHGFHCLVLGPDNNRMDFEIDDAGDIEEDLERNDRFPSATELENSGIKLKRAKRGIREINFKKKWFVFPRLHVPPFTFDGDSEVMLRYLKSYEMEQQLGKSKREVAAYLRLMRDLVQTQKDVKILESRRIIEVKKQHHKDKLPRMLCRLCPAAEEVSLTQNLRLTRLQVIEYKSPPWHLLSLALFLTVVQTVFTILSYFLPRN